MLPFHPTRRILLLSAAGLLFFALLALTRAQPTLAISPDIVISQVYGGGGNSGAIYTNDFIELFNRGTTTVSLAGWSVQYTSATGTGNFGSATNLITPLTGSLAPGQYYLIQEAAGATPAAALPTPDETDSTAINMSGTGGKVALVNTTTPLGCNGSSTPCSPAALATIVDLVGWDGANFFEGSAAPATTNSTSISRASGGCSDTDNNSADFASGAPTPRNTASPLNPCSVSPTPNLSIADVSASEGNSGTTSFDFLINLSIPAGAGGVTFDVATQDNSATTADNDYVANSLTGQTIPAGNSSYTFSVVVNGDTTEEPDETFFVNVTNVTGATVVDGQAQGTILNDDTNFCAQSYTPIYQIQGNGLAAAITGAVTTQGVVVGDYEGASPALRGFYLQDSVGDGDAATSDGIFVFNGNNNSVNLGDVVRVGGTAAEFQDQTQITASSITNCGAASATPVDVAFPVPSTTYLEQYEGMLVRLPQTLYVTEHFQLGRFGQIVMSADARLAQPTNVTTPGAAAIALQTQNNLNRIIIDDALQNQNPDPIIFGRGGNPLSASNTLRGGDTATGIVGIMTYTWAGNAASGNAYRVRPVNALGATLPDFQPANQRPNSPTPVGGTLKVASMNLLNFFNTFDGLPDTVDNCTGGVGGAATDCRGADTQAEFDRQWPKTVAAITAIDPDILAMNEIENDGYGAASAIQFLVDRLNDATAPGTYAFIDADAATGQVNALGTDAIKVGMLYKPARVTPLGTAALNSVAFVNGGDDAPRSRPSLAQAFETTTGARFVVDANHLKSKGSACNTPDAGDGQGNCNIVRTNAAIELANWLATDPTGANDPDVLIIGDLNSYALEDPIATLENAGYLNLIEHLIGADAYSYVFDGQWGYLDHALANGALAPQVTGVTEYHINADEPTVLDYNTDFKSAGQIASLYNADQYRVSDHDPIIVGLNLTAKPIANAGGPYEVDEGGSVTLSASATDPNGGPFTFEWDLDDDGTFETNGQTVTFSAAGRDGPSEQQVKVRVTNSAGLKDKAKTKVIIRNVAPSVDTPVTTPAPSNPNQNVSASATFNDPAGALDEPFACTVDYGDGAGAQAGTVNGNVCEGAPHLYSTIGAYTVTVQVTDKDGDSGTNAVTHQVVFTFNGFFAPVDNLPALNVVKAGSAIPIKFSLGGDQGLNIFAENYPKSEQIACDSTADTDGVEETVTPGASKLKYDPGNDTYTYVWKTKKAWSHTCRQLVVKLADGTTHRANFKFK